MLLDIPRQSWTVLADPAHRLFSLDTVTRYALGVHVDHGAQPINRECRLRWLEPLTTAFGDDHPSTLRARHNIAYWTGETGDTQTALNPFTDLLADVERILGADHPYALSIGFWIARSGGANDGAPAHMDWVG